MSGEQLVRQKPEREDVRLKHRPPDGLLRRHVANGSRTGGTLQCPLSYLGKREITELELIIRKDNEVIGLDVAMDYLAVMGVSNRRERLIEIVQRSRRCQTLTHSLSEGTLT